MSDAKAEPSVTQRVEYWVRAQEETAWQNEDTLWHLRNYQALQSDLANLKAELDAAKSRVNKVADLWIEEANELKAELQVLRADFGTCDAERDTLKAMCAKLAERKDGG